LITENISALFAFFSRALKGRLRFSRGFVPGRIYGRCFCGRERAVPMAGAFPEEGYLICAGRIRLRVGNVSRETKTTF